MAEWLLRPKFQRTPSSFLDEDHPEMEGERVRNPSRVSSYLGLTAHPPTPSLAATDLFNIRNPDVVYEKPSVDHMIESLKVAMMTKDSMESLSIEYNSCVLHLLESYQDLREMVHTKDQTIEEMKQRHTRDIKDFDKRAARWEAREWDYKSEMKKLEVLLAHTEGGMEKVTLARRNSVLRGAPREESRGPGAELMKGENTARNRRDRVNRSFQHHPVVPPGMRLPPRRNTFDAKPQNPQIDVPRKVQVYNSQSQKILALMAPPNKKPKTVGLGLTTQHLDELNQQILEAEVERMTEQMEGDFGVTFESSESSETSSSRKSSNHQMFSNSFNKPLPKIPNSNVLGNGTAAVDEVLRRTKPPSSPWVDVDPTDQVSVLPHRKGFSFRPGDDTHDSFTAAEISRARAKRELLEEHLRQKELRAQKLQLTRSDTTSEETVQAFEQASQNDAARVSVESLGTPKSHLSAEGLPKPIRPELPTQDFGRRNSSSSIVTAIRDNSGRSSVNGSYTGGRKKFNRSSGSSEAATIALARAIVSRSGSEGSDKNGTRHQREVSSTHTEVLHEEREEETRW